MDPVTVTALLLSGLALAQNIHKVISASTRLQDPRVDQVYYRLLAEKKRTEGWASHMRVLNSTDLRATIPPEEYDEVVILLKKLDAYYRQAQEKFIAIEPSKEGPITIPFLKARARFLAGGYENLRDFVDTLAAMNKALKSIAPPLPSYSPGAFRDRSPIRVSSVLSLDSFSISNSSSMPQERAQSVHEKQNLDEPIRILSVHSIYEATLDALAVLSTRLRSPQIAYSASRLRVWGAGLFKMTTPIDLVFENDEGECQLLRNCILKILVEILVWEEQELNNLAGEASTKEQLQDQRRAQATSALLGSDELIGFALESWKHLLERQFDMNPDAATSKTGGDLIPELIQILFDLLPTLRAARQTYRIRLAEARAQSATVMQNQADEITSSSSVKPSSDSVERKLEAVDEILSKRDKVATKRGQNVKLYSPVFRKERERLREFYASQSKRSLPKDQDRKQLEWRHNELDTTLAAFIKNNAQKSDTEVAEEMKPRKPRSEKSWSEEGKISIRQEEEGRVDEIINFLRSTNEDLWSISGAR